MARFYGASSALTGAIVLTFGLSVTAQSASVRLATWQQAIVKAPTPAAGCFTADYPSFKWRRVACTVAPLRPYMPRNGRAGRTVGDGNDYAAQTTDNTTAATGSFTTVKGVTKETNNSHTNEYSLQLNSNFSNNSVACDTAKNPGDCLAWEQFVYAQEGGNDANGQLFMQYWLIDYNTKCPKGWFRSSKDCYRNSDTAASVPVQKLSKFADLELTGAAVGSGLDTITLVTASHAYSTTGNDSVVDLANFWNQSEFNVIGNGNGSEAKFNKGSTITVKIAVTDGTMNVPVCEANAGTTAETNNLSLGKCKATGGAMPFVKFTESN